jgi:small-conductance mechanosensitive channel
LSLQLQFAIYKLRQRKAKETQKQSEIAYNTLYTPLLNALEKVSFKIEKTQQEKTDKEIEVLDKKIVALQVKKERQLITAEQVDPAIEKQLESYQKEIEKLYLKQIGFKVTKLLELIQAKSSEELFNELHNFEVLFSNIKGGEELHDEYGHVLQNFIKTKLGTMTVLFSSMKQNTQQIVYDFFEWFSNPLFVYNEQPVSMIDILKVILILFVGFFIGWLYKKRVLSLREKQVKMSLMSIKLLANVGYYIIILITFIIALGSIGLDLTSLSLIAGALSIGIGFGLQTVVSNFVAGIILMFERSIRIGDLLEIDGTFKGEVTDIRIRSTTIKTFDNIEVIVPNATFIQQNVINWTLEDRIRRLHVPFSVAYGTNIDFVIETILKALEESPLNHLRNIKNKEAKVWMTAMGGSSLDMELLVWIKSGVKNMPLQTDFLILIYKTLNQHKIEIPFPQMDVHLKKG